MKRIVLASRPQGEPTPANFRLEEVPTPEPGEGQILVEVSHRPTAPPTMVSSRAWGSA